MPPRAGAGSWSGASPCPRPEATTRCVGPRPRSPKGSASRPSRSTPSPCGRRSSATLPGRCARACHPRPSGPNARLEWSPPPTRWSPAGRMSPGRARPSPRAREGPRVEEWEEPGSSSRATGSPVLGSGTSGSPRNPRRWVPSSPAAPAATPTTSPPPWPDRGLALGPGEGGRDAVCRGAVLQRGEGRGGGTRRSGTGRASTVTSSGPCRPLPGWPRSQARRRGKGCPSGLVSVRVPEMCRRLVVALPARSLELGLVWSWWRRVRRWRARCRHSRRRALPSGHDPP
jgi:hypothetical protein